MRVLRFIFASLAVLSISGLAYAGQAASPSFVDPASYFEAADEETTAEVGSSASIAGKCGCDVDLNDACNQCCQPCWIVSVGAVALQHGTPRSTPLVTTLGGATILDANQFKFNYAVGPDIYAVRQVSRFERFDAVDFRFFDVQSSSAFTLPTTGGVAFAVPTSPIPMVGLNSSTVSATYGSRLYSTEFNLRRNTMGGRVTLLAGFRWVQLNEQLNIAGNYVVTGQSNLLFGTQNNLYGAQVGADVKLWSRGGPLSVVATGKAGLYGNASRAQSTLVGFPVASTSEQVTRLAFLGDIYINALYQVSEHVAVRGGWEAIFIQGTAAATDQPASTNFLTGSGINTAGFTFYQGLMGSVTFLW